MRMWQCRDSSQVAEYGYDPDRRLLVIEFKSGGVYEYRGVPFDVFEGFIDAPSKGKFINQHIKGNYECEKQEQGE